MPSFQEGLEQQIYMARRGWLSSFKARERKAARSEIGSGSPSPASPEQPGDQEVSSNVTGSNMSICTKSGVVPDSVQPGLSRPGPSQSAPEEGPHAGLPYDPVRQL